MARHLFLVLSEATAGQEEEYHRWYTDDHLADVLKVPGFVAAQRFALPVEPGQAPRFLAIYELETDDAEAAVAELRARKGTTLMPISPAINLDITRFGLATPISERIMVKEHTYI